MRTAPRGELPRRLGRLQLELSAAHASALLVALALVGALPVRAQVPAEDEPVPVTVSATPTMVWVGKPVTLAGESAITPSLRTVTLTIRSENGTQAGPIVLHITPDESGAFRTSFTPSAAGNYTLQATAPDGKGHADTRFSAEDPASLGQESAQTLEDTAADAAAILQAGKQKIAALPPSPARDDAVRDLGEIDGEIATLRRDSVQADRALPAILRLSTRLKSNAKLDAERDALLAALDEARRSREHSRAVLQEMSGARTTCDNLEVVVEGFKWVSVLLNLASGKPSAVAGSFVKDLAAALVAQGAQAAGAGEATGFGAAEVVQDAGILQQETAVARIIDKGVVGNIEHVSLDAGTIVGALNRYLGKKAEQTMSQYCVQFTGPVKAHMHAQFFQDGIKWWEYSFDLTAQLTVHYPRDASGDVIPLRGRLEGFGHHFRLWEDALRVQYPKLMASAVQRKFLFMPVGLNGGGDSLGAQYTAEGSVFGRIVTPNSFFFEVTGTATKDRLTLTIGASRADMDPQARVVVIMVPVLSAGWPAWTTYTLPFKNAHFVFERASDSDYEIPLTTIGKTIRGRKTFSNKREKPEARGEYTVDIQACNPGCAE